VAVKAGRSLGSDGALMLAATMVLNLSMVLYHREMSRRLGVGYGDLAAVTGVVNVSAIILAGLATWLTRQLAHQAALGGEAAALGRLAKLAPSLLLGGAAYVASLWAAGAWLGPWLRLASSDYILWACAVAAGGIVTVVSRSLLQAAHRFRALAVSFALEGLGRVGLGVLFAASMGVSGALAGTAVTGFAIAVCALPMLWTARRRRLSMDLAPEASHGWQGLLRDSLALALFSLICFLDIFVVKNALGGVDDAAVAFHSRAALAAKSFLYISTAVNLVALPHISAAFARGQDARPLLGRFLGAMALVQALGLAAFWLTTPWALSLLLGPIPELPQLVPITRVFALAVVPLALLQLVLVHGLAVGAPGFVRLLAVTAGLYYLALRAWGPAPMAVVLCLAGVATVALAGGLALVLRPAAPIHRP
jgi:O-antigen/teichoic acid export membrane protein